MIHQPSGGAQGQASDISIHAEEILKIRRRLNELMASILVVLMMKLPRILSVIIS